MGLPDGQHEERELKEEEGKPLPAGCDLESGEETEEPKQTS